MKLNDVRRLKSLLRVALISTLVVIGHQVLMVGVDAFSLNHVDAELAGVGESHSQNHQLTNAVHHGSDEAHTQCAPGHEIVVRSHSNDEDEISSGQTILYPLLLERTSEQSDAPFPTDWNWMSFDAQAILQVFLN